MEFFKKLFSTSIEPKPILPQTHQELIELLAKLPKTALSDRERDIIIAAMTYPETKVSALMLPESEITYVSKTETLGPLVLDQLYRSGSQHFPVIDGRHHVVGLLHTRDLNQLSTKNTVTAADVLDPTVYYMRADYFLTKAMSAFLRTNCHFFLVIDQNNRLVGLLTYQMLIEFLLGSLPVDDFDQDTDRTAVAKRQS